MARYIDADLLLERLSKKKSEVAKGRYTEGFNDAIMRVRSMVSSASTADVVPKSEVDLYKRQVDELEDELAQTYDKLETAKTEIAREIFEEIEYRIAIQAFTSKSEDYAEGMFDAIEWVDSKIDELKKKYVGSIENN